MKAKVFTFESILILCVLLLVSFFYLTNYWISTDAPVYLSFARDIAEGNSLYDDIYCSYVPLVIYVNSIIFKIFGFEYIYFILFQFFIILLSSVSLFFLCNMFRKNISESIFTSLLFLLTVFCADGFEFILEPYLLLFTFCGLLSLYKSRFILSGLFIGFAVLSKQYGYVYYPIFLILIYYENLLNYKTLFLFSLGFLIPQFLFITVMTVLYGVSLEYLIIQLSGSQYDFNGSTFEVGLFEYLIGGKVLFSLLILYFMSFKLNKDIILLLIMLIISLIPTLIKTYQHYFLISFPIFYLILIKSELRRQFLFNKIIFIIVIISNSFLLINRINKYKYKRENQITKSFELLREHKRGSEILIEGNIYLYLTNNYKNPLVSKFGYQFFYKIPEAEKNKFKRLKID
jgi:4-amino-4-deoxy-L-arabinose transferase-like glycosyltransferase